VIEGYATAGGFEIMVNSDFAIMEENAKMGDFHMRRALFGGAGPMYRLPRILGERKAKELMLTGKLLSGKEAYEWGLVNAWAPAEELDACVDNFVADLTDKSPFQMSITKMAVNRGLDADTETLMLIERLAVGVTLNSKDAAEGVNAFLNKREPVWSGA
jgi:enoyl-CoA hydratase/carnithine racemase